MAQRSATKVRIDDLPSNLPFGELVGHLLRDLQPTQPMWTAFWFKALAVRQGVLWRLCYYSLSGRWSDIPPPEAFEVNERQDTLIMVSRLIDASVAWKQLKSLARGKLTLQARVTAVTPSQAFLGSPYYQTTLPSWATQEEIVTNVAESTAHWRYVFMMGQADFLRPGEPTNAPEEEQVYKSVQTALQFYNAPTFHELLGRYFGGDTRGGSRYEARRFSAVLDFPLALEVQRDLPEHPVDQQRIHFICLPPLTPSGLRVQVGPAFRSQGPYLPITPWKEATGPGQWADGSILLPNASQKLWIQAPSTLRKVLHYTLELPTPEAQMAEALWQLYHQTAPKEGKQRWRKALLEGAGPDFEIALMNTLARLGIPVVFAGDIAEMRDGTLVHGGPQVEGYDLIVTNYATKRVVFLSIKGSESHKGEGYAPKDEDGAKLLKGVESFQQSLPPSWEVLGIIVCQAPERRLRKWKPIEDIRVWGKESLEALLQADSRDVVELWLGLKPSTAPLIPLSLVERGRQE